MENFAPPLQRAGPFLSSRRQPAQPYTVITAVVERNCSNELPDKPSRVRRSREAFSVCFACVWPLLRSMTDAFSGQSLTLSFQACKLWPRAASRRTHRRHRGDEFKTAEHRISVVAVPSWARGTKKALGGWRPSHPTEGGALLFKVSPADYDQRPQKSTAGGIVRFPAHELGLIHIAASQELDLSKHPVELEASGTYTVVLDNQSRIRALSSPTACLYARSIGSGPLATRHYCILYDGEWRP